MPQAVIGLKMAWRVLVLDGSKSECCETTCRKLEAQFGLPLRHVRRPARGIYEAMNEAVVLAEGQLLAFMNAGDRYRPGGLTALVHHWWLQEQPVAVFGQAWVRPAKPWKPWLTPDPSMRRLDCWLKVMVPCHQAFLFRADFARAHPYPPGSLIADRSVIRAALALVGPEAYLRWPICEYDLSGLSSALPYGKELLQRLSDPQRSVKERFAELVKALVGFVLPGWYPWLMRSRAVFWGWWCR